MLFQEYFFFLNFSESALGIATLILNQVLVLLAISGIPERLHRVSF